MKENVGAEEVGVSSKKRDSKREEEGLVKMK